MRCGTGRSAWSWISPGTPGASRRRAAGSGSSWGSTATRCGARKVWLQLRREGIPAARCTAGRLMRQRGLRGVRRGRRTRTTIPAAAASQPPDLVKRNFAAPAPNRLRVAGITYVPIWSGGFAYVAFVIDAFSRMITGWKAAGHMRTSLALDALEMAVSARLRAGQQVAGVIHHSDYAEVCVKPRNPDSAMSRGLACLIPRLNDVVLPQAVEGL